MKTIHKNKRVVELFYRGFMVLFVLAFITVYISVIGLDKKKPESSQYISGRHHVMVRIDIDSYRRSLSDYEERRAYWRVVLWAGLIAAAVGLTGRMVTYLRLGDIEQDERRRRLWPHRYS